jgi:hypothetical protein
LAGQTNVLGFEAAASILSGRGDVFVVVVEFCLGVVVR